MTTQQLMEGQAQFMRIMLAQQMQEASHRREDLRAQDLDRKEAARRDDMAHKEREEDRNADVFFAFVFALFAPSR